MLQRAIPNHREFYGYIFLAIAVISFLIAYPLIARATDNTTARHWHSETTTFRIGGSVPSGWHTDINNAGIDWDQNTLVGLTQVHTGMPANVHADDEVPGYYLCTNFSYLAACTFVGVDGSGHILGAEITYNDAKTWIHNCSTSYDVEFVGIHEFGHVAGGLDDSTSDSDAIMFQGGDCATSLDEHDIDSMNAVYGSH